MVNNTFSNDDRKAQKTQTKLFLTQLDAVTTIVADYLTDNETETTVNQAIGYYEQ